MGADSVGSSISDAGPQRTSASPVKHSLNACTHKHTYMSVHTYTHTHTPTHTHTHTPTSPFSENKA